MIRGGFAVVFTGTCLSAADSLTGGIGKIFKQHCYDCHDEGTQKGGLNLLDIPFSGEQLTIWTNNYDRIEKGEMPPEKKPRPAPELAAAALGEVADFLKTSTAHQYAKRGRVIKRRLNRVE